MSPEYFVEIFSILASVFSDFCLGNNRLRDSSTVEEDLSFWQDQKDPTKRKMFIGGKDSAYERKVEGKRRRIKKLHLLKPDLKIV